MHLSNALNRGANADRHPRAEPVGDSVRKLSAVTLLAVTSILLTPCGGISESRWPDERTAGPFVCHADFQLAGHMPLLAEMARLQQDLGQTLGVELPQERIHMFLFQRKSTYQEYIAQYFPTVPFRQALFIKERGPGMVFAYRSSEFEVDLRHESTHALLHAALPMVPLWLDEGIAEYFEVRPEQRAGAHPHLGKLRWGVRFGPVPSLERLEKVETLGEMGQSEYRSAWAWVHFMMHGSSEAHQELVRFLQDIQAHSPPGLLSIRLRRQIPDLEDRFAEHFRTWR